MVDFVRGGKGLGGTHSATDTYKNWKEYNTMMGGAFAGHPWHTEVPVRLLDASHPLNKVFQGKGFTVRDEIYQFRDDTASPTERKMLLSLDPSWDQLGKGKRKDGTKYLPQWKWRCTFRDAYQVCLLIWPFAHTKLPKIQQIIEHYSTEKLKQNNVVDLEEYRNARQVHI